MCLSRHLHRANELRKRIDSVVLAVTFESVCHLDARLRIDKIDGSGLNGALTSKHEFNDIVPRCSASRGDDRDIDCLRRIVDKTHHDGSNGGSRQSASAE